MVNKLNEGELKQEITRVKNMEILDRKKERTRKW